MINFIFCIIMFCYASYINYSWYKDCNKLNDRWAERCHKLNDKWAEQYNELNKKLVDICQKIREEKKDD